MVTVILVVHMLIALGLVGIVLIQRSEGGGLGIGGGGGGGGGGFMTGRASANLLTRTTAILATAFFATSMLLAIMTTGSHNQRSIIGQPPNSAVPAPGTMPGATAPVAPAKPAEPAVPAAR